MIKYAFSDLYEMSSGISTTKSQAGHGSPFLSFGTAFKNYFLPDDLPDLMYTNEREQEIFSIKKGDIFLTRTSETVDELAMSSVSLKDYPNATFSGFLKRLRPKKEFLVYDKFIGFYLRSAYFRKVITNNTIMTLRASFNEDMFSFLDLFLPDYNTQVKIGNLLFNIEKKIQVNKKINDNLLKQVALLFDYWFVQFNFSNENGMPYRSSGGKMIWNERLNREIPAGWSDASIVNNPLSLLIKPGVDVFDCKEYLATADVNGTSISTGNSIGYATRESRANMQPTMFSVWFAKMKNSNKHLFLNEEMLPLIEKTILSTGFCGIQCTEQSFEFLASFIENKNFEIMKDILAHGATQEAVNNNDMESIRFAVPSDDVLKKYHEATRGIFAQFSRNTCENRILINMRDWLLPMLMNGQAVISD